MACNGPRRMAADATRAGSTACGRARDSGEQPRPTSSPVAAESAPERRPTPWAHIAGTAAPPGVDSGVNCPRPSGWAPSGRASGTTVPGRRAVVAEGEKRPGLSQADLNDEATDEFAGHGTLAS